VVETSTKRETSRFCAPFLIDSDEKLRWTDGGTTDYYQIVGKGTGERYLEGDTWAFALLSSRCRADLAQQEVLYVGKAFGKKGERTALDRILSHSTIQRIYAEHQSTTYDIFIGFLRVTSAGSLAMLQSRESLAAFDRIGYIGVRHVDVSASP
jgi:hypothetical protein